MSNHAEDELMLHIGEGMEFLMTRHNTRLYTFIGNLATRNHLFLILEETEDSYMGHRVFAHNDSYPALAYFMVEHEYPMNLNSTEVPELDEEAFQRSLDQLTDSDDTPDTLPDDWA